MKQMLFEDKDKVSHLNALHGNRKIKFVVAVIIH